MKNAFFISFLFVAVLVLQGCYVKSDVTTFHKMPAAPASYAFIYLDNQANDLEYQNYKALVREKLAKLNYTETSREDAALFVAFTYAVDNGTASHGSVPMFGNTTPSSSTTSGTYNSGYDYGNFNATTTYAPTFGVVGQVNYTEVNYNRVLRLNILSRDSSGNNIFVYQGSVKSNGTSSNLSEIVPHMINAIFENFPGDSGETYMSVGM